MGHKILIPGVPGEFDIHSTRNEDGSIKDMVFCFDSPKVDDLFESLRNYFVTKRLAEKFETHNFKGYKLEELQTKLSPDYIEVYGNAEIPEASRLVVTGTKESDDFLLRDGRLSVSSKALELIIGSTLEYPIQIMSDMSEYESPIDRIKRLKKEGKHLDTKKGAKIKVLK